MIQKNVSSGHDEGKMPCDRAPIEVFFLIMGKEMGKKRERIRETGLWRQEQ